MIARLYYVACDECGRSLGEPARSAAEARRLTRVDRWSRVRRRQANHPLGPSKGRDYCPACVVAKQAVRDAIRADVDDERRAARGA